MISNKPENTGGMPTRQKIVAALIVIIILVVIWQIWGLFGSSEPAAPVITPTTTPPAATPGGPAVPPGTMPATPPGAPVATPAPVPAAVPKTTPTPTTHPDLLKIQQENQQKYISTMNDLQFLRLQREVAQTNEAIAAAKLATVKSEKEIADTLTRPAATAAAATAAMNVPQFPASAYGPGLTSPVPSGQAVVTGPPTQEQQPAPTVAEVPQPPTPVGYVVVSVSMQLNRWSAVLGYQGKLYNVSVGDVLPVDGSRVVSINRSGVVLKRDGETKKVSLVPAI